MITNFFIWLRTKLNINKLKVIARSKHVISRENINSNALKVLYRLHKQGYRGLLVGGCLRDLILGVHPKDFDIATDAHPEEVKEIFSNCRLIGRRFRLAHIHFGREILEVATFRSNHDDSASNQHGMIMRDNEYGTIEEDVQRRDFTINALYYDIADFSIYDYVGGMHDLKKGIIRLIGDPDIRYREDPVRMLRAVRFAAKLNFKIDERSKKLIPKLSYLIDNVPAARLFEEYMKLFLSGRAVKTYDLLYEYNLLYYLFPTVKQYPEYEKLFRIALENTDDRCRQGKSIAPGFLLAVFYWPEYKSLSEELSKTLKHYEVLQLTPDKILANNQKHISIPRRFSNIIRDIWDMQYRLGNRSKNRATKVFNSSSFRAGYDFLLLLAEFDNKHKELADWWTKYSKSSENVRREMVEKIPSNKPKRKKRTNKKKNSNETSDVESTNLNEE